jgi:hypothetical protein
LRKLLQLAVLAAILFPHGAKAQLSGTCPYSAVSGPWYWSVTDTSPGTQVWNGNTGAFVVLADATYTAWVAKGCTATVVPTMVGLNAFINQIALSRWLPSGQQIAAGTTNVLTNPLKSIIIANAGGVDVTITLPLQNLPNSIPLGAYVSIYWLGTPGKKLQIYKNDGTTLVATVYAPNDGVTITPYDNSSTNGSYYVVSYNVGALSPGQGTAGQLYVAQGAATAGWQSLSGDCTNNSSLAITCTKTNGVTHPSSFTSGGIPYASGTGAISSSALLAANALIVGGGAGTAPSTLASLGTTTTVLHGNGSGSPSFAAVGTGDVSFAIEPGGRLTLTSGNPASPGVTAATTIYYAPYTSPYVPIYNGTNTIPYQFTSSATDTVGLSVALGSNWAASTNYDWFVGLNSAVVTLCSGPSWNSGTAGSNTARGTGAGSTELQKYNGRWTNKNSMTCRYANASTFTCAVNQCTYLGTARTNASTGQIDFTYGSSVASGGTANLMVWNYYNRITINSGTVDDSSSWNYSSATIRSVDGSTANRINFISGMAEDGIPVMYSRTLGPPNAATYYQIGHNIDSTTVFGARCLTLTVTGASALFAQQTCFGPYAAQLGFHFFQALEAGDGTNIWSNAGGSSGGLSAQFRM